MPVCAVHTQTNIPAAWLCVELLVNEILTAHWEHGFLIWLHRSWGGVGGGRCEVRRGDQWWAQTYELDELCFWISNSWCCLIWLFLLEILASLLKLLLLLKPVSQPVLNNINRTVDDHNQSCVLATVRIDNKINHLDDGKELPQNTINKNGILNLCNVS